MGCCSSIVDILSTMLWAVLLQVFVGWSCINESCNLLLFYGCSYNPSDKSWVFVVFLKVNVGLQLLKVAWTTWCWVPIVLQTPKLYIEWLNFVYNGYDGWLLATCITENWVRWQYSIGLMHIRIFSIVLYTLGVYRCHLWYGAPSHGFWFLACAIYNIV